MSPKAAILDRNCFCEQGTSALIQVALSTPPKGSALSAICRSSCPHTAGSAAPGAAPAAGPAPIQGLLI